MRLGSSVDKNTLDLLDRSWLDSLIYTHAADPVHVMQSPLLAEEFVNGSTSIRAL